MKDIREYVGFVYDIPTYIGFMLIGQAIRDSNYQDD